MPAGIVQRRICSLEGPACFIRARCGLMRLQGAANSECRTLQQHHLDRAAPRAGGLARKCAVAHVGTSPGGSAAQWCLFVACTVCSIGRRGRTTRSSFFGCLLVVPCGWKNGLLTSAPHDPVAAAPADAPGGLLRAV